MENKATQTLLGLCRAYHKIEIPILQRDYAQGHSAGVRKPFVAYLVNAICEGSRVELDFIYGGERQEDTGKVLIPLDGQQRLTTLWLLYWYMAVKDDKLEGELRSALARFVYEARPAAMDFCRYMLRLQENENLELDLLLQKPKVCITDYSWYNPAWRKDTTVSGMLQMLEEIAGHYEMLKDIPFDRLEQCLAFYHLPLEQFGLTNDLYIRMNARGVQLTEFEHFKSQFYKAIERHPDLDEIKVKMETIWVEHLWQYRESGADVVDKPFMGLLRFVSLVNDVYRCQPSEGYKVKGEELMSLPFLSELYGDADCVARLISTLEIIPLFNQLQLSKKRLRLDGEMRDLSHLIKQMFEGRDLSRDTNATALMYAVIQYLRVQKRADGIESYLQIVRNLSVNTDYQNRDLPRAFAAIDMLAEQTDVYAYLADGDDLPFFTTQLKEERWKARYFRQYPEKMMLIHKVEDEPYLLGQIATLLLVVGDKRSIDELVVEEVQAERLALLYDKYSELATNKFVDIWGDLLNTELYEDRVEWGRVLYDKRFSKNYALVSFILRYAESGAGLEDFCRATERREVLRLYDVYQGDLSQCRKSKEQLYLYYVISRRLMKSRVEQFFAGGYNFGYLAKEKGYSSIFSAGIDGNPWFGEVNPIYQSYSSQFRYNQGLKTSASLPPELDSEVRIKEVWKELLKWCKN